MQHALLPLSALIRRELLRHLRRKRVILSVAFLGGIMMWVVWESWPNEVMQAARLYAAADTLSNALLLLYIGAAMLVLPGFAAMCVRSEHDSQTYELMRLTLLTPVSIMLGTLANIMGLFSLAFVATFPVFVLAYVLAPLTWWSATLNIAIIVLTALLCAAAGLFVSTRRRKGADSIGAAYGITAGTAFPSFVIPFIVVHAAGGSEIWIPIGVAALLAVFALVMLGTSVINLHSYSYERIQTLQSKYTFMDRGMLTRHARRSRPPIADGKNPVFVREFGDALKRAQINRASLMVTVILAAVLFGMNAFMVEGSDGQYASWTESAAHSLQWYFVSTMLIAAATIPGISTPAWTNDRNSEMEEALDLTLLTRRQRFLGRACAAAALPATVTACWAAGFLPLLRAAISTPHGATIVLIGVIGLVATVVNLLALGRFVARMPLGTPTAVALVHLFTLAYVGLPCWGLSSFQDVSIVEALTAAISPIAAMVCAVRMVKMEQAGLGLAVYAIAFAGMQSTLFAVLAWREIKSGIKKRRERTQFAAGNRDQEKGPRSD
jgi:hypothetical protein